MKPENQPQWVDICSVQDLVPNSGVAALVNEQQIALFYVPSKTPAIYAIGNYDPIGGAQVLSRGIVGDVAGELVVASPLYKQHFRLNDGSCIEDETSFAGSWPSKVEDGRVKLMIG